MMVTDVEAGQAAAEEPETDQETEKARREIGHARQPADSETATMIETEDQEEIADEETVQGAMTTATGKKGETMEIVHTEEVWAVMSP
jgi:hypothetical protein